MGAWVPGRAVPWCLGPLPWTPGAPPGGSLGGGPDPNYKDQKWAGAPWIRIKIYVDFDVDFGSSWGRSWGSFLALLAAKLGQVRSQTRFENLSNQKANPHGMLRLRGAQERPISAEEGSKTLLEGDFLHHENRLKF